MVSFMHQHESAISIHMSPPSRTLRPPASPSYPSRLSRSTSFAFPESYIKFPLAILHMHVLINFPQYSNRY